MAKPKTVLQAAGQILGFAPKADRLASLEAALRDAESDLELAIIRRDESFAESAQTGVDASRAVAELVSSAEHRVDAARRTLEAFRKALTDHQENAAAGARAVAWEKVQDLARQRTAVSVRAMDLVKELGAVVTELNDLGKQILMTMPTKSAHPMELKLQPSQIQAALEISMMRAGAIANAKGSLLSGFPGLDHVVVSSAGLVAQKVAEGITA